MANSMRYGSRNLTPQPKAAKATAFGKPKYAPKVPVRPGISYGEYRTAYADPQVVAAVQRVFDQQRLGHEGWQSRQLYGRLELRSAWRLTLKGEQDVYRERRSPSPTKLNVHLLVDASGSMHGWNSTNAQDFVATMIAAFRRIPTVRLHVWQHSAYQDCTIYRVYEPGMNDEGVNRMNMNVGGGNADGFALEAIGQRALRLAKRDEQTLIVMISDGLPSVEGTNATNHDMIAHTKLVCQTLRGKGAKILSVAIAGGANHNAQMYGTENTVAFTNDWTKLGLDFAALFGRTLRAARQR
jgi:hypothetical protein